MQIILSKKLLVCFFFILTAISLIIAQPRKTYDGPAVGLSLGYTFGKPSFENLFDRAESFKSMEYGIFGRFHVFGVLFVQPEINYFERQFEGYIGHVPNTSGKPDISQKHKLIDIGLIAHLAFGEKIIRPFLAGGLSISFFKREEITTISPVNGFEMLLFKINTNDANLIFGGGVKVGLPGDIDLALGGRYYLAMNNLRYLNNNYGGLLNRVYIQLAFAKRFNT